MKPLHLKNGSRDLSGFAQVIDSQIWIHFCGRTFAVPTQTSSAARKTSGRASFPKSEQVVSPMPGKITKILVKVGELVEENQSILIMEAMKMEYALKSEVAGHVKELRFALGEQVCLGAVVAVIAGSEKLP